MPGRAAGHFGKPLASMKERIVPLKNKVKAKHIFIFIAIGILYFAGISAMLYPTASNVLSLLSSHSVIQNYERKVAEMDTSDIDAIFHKADQYNQDVHRHIYHDGLEHCLCNEEGLMCYVDIPAIRVYLPVYYGTTNEVLQKGCGFIENTSLPVGGKSTHSVISGHTGLPSAEMFTKLDMLKEDDVFYIHVLNRVLAYKVDKIKVVYPDVVSDLSIVNNMDYCTLLTCTPYGINDKRLLVRGIRIPYDQQSTSVETIAEQTNDPVDESLQSEINQSLNVIIAIAAGAVLLYLIALIWLLASIKKLPAQQKEQAEENHGNAEKTN